MVDIDGDGLLDIIAANDNMANFFFSQRADHTFEDASVLWGVEEHDERMTFGVLATDFDNDGDADVYFINRGYPGQPNRVLRNDISTTGILTDVSLTSGDGATDSSNFGGTALDYDLDGDLDIFLTTVSPNRTNVLLRNDGDLFFTDVSAEAELTQLAWSRHCSTGDYNNDGWFDIAVGSAYGANLLLRNDGDGTFTEVAEAAGVQTPEENFGLVLEDFDNDGWQDIFVPKYLLEGDGTSLLYRNNGDGTFSDVTPGSGMTGQTDMGHNTGDLDADGYPDIFIGTGNPAFPDLIRLFLVRPDAPEGLVATDYSTESGVTAQGAVRCHGVAIGDYDQDGLLDVYNNNGGPSGLPETFEANFLWQGQSNGNAWTALNLTGVTSNRSGIGARIVAFTSAGREVHRMLRAGNGFANTDSPTVHIGIGQDESIHRVEITWPSGILQTILQPPLYQVLDVVEDVEGGLIFSDGFESGDTCSWSSGCAEQPEGSSEVAGEG